MFQQRGALGRVAEIDRIRRERDVVLVQRDQRLPAERCKRMEMQRQRHAGTLYWTQDWSYTDCVLQLVADWVN
jgi:hypothetical protein